MRKTILFLCLLGFGTVAANAVPNNYMVENTSGTDTATGAFCYDFQTRPTCSARITNLTASISTTSFPSGSTSYIQNTNTPTTATQIFNVATGTVANMAISSMTTVLPMSARKITGLANGTVATDGAAFGQIITNPPIMTVTNVSSCTTSTSYVPTNSTNTFTPSSATRRVKISFYGACSNTSGAAGRMTYTIFRGVTDLATSTNGLFGLQITTSVNDGPCSMSVIDSPATTSATVYSVRMKSSGGGITGCIAPDNQDSTLIAEEVY